MQPNDEIFSEERAFLLRVKELDNENLRLRIKLLESDREAIHNGDNRIIPVAENNNGTTGKWVADNLPENRESTTQYYNRYLESFAGRKLPANMFSTVVKNTGYHVIQGTNGRYWSK